MFRTKTKALAFDKSIITECAALKRAPLFKVLRNPTSVCASPHAKYIIYQHNYGGSDVHYILSTRQTCFHGGAVFDYTFARRKVKRANLPDTYTHRTYQRKVVLRAVAIRQTTTTTTTTYKTSAVTGAAGLSLFPHNLRCVLTEKAV